MKPFTPLTYWMMTLSNFFSSLLFITLLVSCSDNSLESEYIKDENDTDPHRHYDYNEFYDNKSYVFRSELLNHLAKADKIEAYNFNEAEESAANADRYMVNAYGDMNSSARLVTELNQENRDTLFALLSDTSLYKNEALSTCFFPHTSFLFYEKESLIGQVGVCLQCSGILCQPKFQSVFNRNGYNRMMNFCESLGLSIYSWPYPEYGD